MIYRSSHWRCSVRKGVFRNFEKFAGKHLCQSLFFNKVAGLGPKRCNFIKKETLAQVFSCEFCEISKKTFFIEHLRATASGYITLIWVWLKWCANNKKGAFSRDLALIRANTVNIFQLKKKNYTAFKYFQHQKRWLKAWRQ